MSRPRPTKQLKCDEYTIGWICPIEIEFSASRFILDEEHKHPKVPADDKNQYFCGQVNGEDDVIYNVVIGCFPSGYQGTVASGALASRMAKTFDSLQLNLLVGIGGGVPDPKDIRLGDVIVAQPTGEHGGVVQYDLGKETVSGFKRKGILLPPPPAWLAALNRMKSDHRAYGNRVPEYLNAMFERYPALEEHYGRPEDDVLYASGYHHPDGQPDCSACDNLRIRTRKTRRAPTKPNIHYGLVASGNAVMKNAERRDALSKELGGADCFEMEAAGLATDTSDFRCIVIRGVSDYADSHKNDDWHGYAAAAAAAVAKELLTYMPIDVTEVMSSSTAAAQASNNPSGSGSSHTWQNNHAQGNARVQNGHVYGNVVYNDVNHYNNQKSPVERLLDSLSFPGMDKYHERPLDSHEGTYEWLFDDSRAIHCCEKCVAVLQDKPCENCVGVSEKSRCADCRSCRESAEYSKILLMEAAKFRAWLRTSQEIFWVSGKAGAGKSCLMKFLFDHKRTTAMLREWAGQQVLPVGFFFWAAGGELEKSYSGLLRSLLHQILQGQHNLVESLLDSIKDIIDGKRPWTLPRLQDALRTTVTDTAASLSFVFFIDGLDEFQGDTQDLLKALNILNQSRNIKLIDDLDPRKDSAYDLVKAVRNKAEGVFLWVSLAVKSLRRSMGDMWSVSEMLESLDEIPPELEDLMQKIFDSIDPVHHQSASRTFLLLLECGSAKRYPTPMGGKLPLLWLAILVKDAKDASCNDKEPATREECMDMITKADQAARRWCKDLVDVVREEGRERDNKHAVTDEIRPGFCLNFLQFPHRTIKDYIFRRKADGTLARLAGNDDYSSPALVLCSIAAQLIPRYACLEYRFCVYHMFGQIGEGVEDNKGSSLVGMAIALNNDFQSLQRVGRASRHWTWEWEWFYGAIGNFDLDPNDDSITIFMALLLFDRFDWLFWLMFDTMPQSANAYAKQLWLSVSISRWPDGEEHDDGLAQSIESVSKLLQQGADLNTSVSPEDYHEHRSVWGMYLMVLYWDLDDAVEYYRLDWLDLVLQYGADPGALLPVAWLEHEPAWMKAEHKANDAAEIEGLPNLTDEPSSGAGVRLEGITSRQEPTAASAPMSPISRPKPHVVPATSVFDLPVRRSRLLERPDDIEERIEKFFPLFKAKLVAASEAKAAREAGVAEGMARQQKRGRQLSGGSEGDHAAARSGSKRQQH